MEQEQQKQEGPSQRTSDLYSQYQNLRFLGSLGRLGGRLAVQTGARVGAAVFGVLGAIGLPLWAFIGILAGIFLFVFVVVLAGPTGTTPTTSAGSFVSGPVRPPSGDFNTLRVNIENDYKISFVGFDSTLYYNYLKWAWEKLEQIKTTKFLDLVKKGNDKITITITKTKVDQCFNQATGPTSLELSGKSCVTQAPYPKELFQIVFIHELTHIISAYNPNSRFDELQKILSLRQEDYLTGYSKNAGKCYGSNNDNEDYSEMIAYFLNPDFPEQDLGPTDCKPSEETRTKNPYKTGRFPLHQKLAAEILGISLSPPTPITSAAKLSCPVDGGTITYPSFQANEETGHCGKNYVNRAKELGYDETQYACNTGSRRAKSVDVLTDGGPNGKEVKLPFIDGKRLNWTRIEGVLQLSRTDCFPEEMLPGFDCGVGVAFTAKDEMGNSWVLQLFHMYEPSLAIDVGQTRQSGEVVGKSEAIHTHVTIGKNVSGDQAFATAGSSDTRSGWLAPDLQMGMCQ